MYVCIHSFLLAVQKDIKGMAGKAILHTAVAINSVIEEVVHSPVVVGSEVTFFFPGLGFNWNPWIPLFHQS